MKEIAFADNNIDLDDPRQWPWYKWRPGYGVIFFYLLAVNVSAIGGLIWFHSAAWPYVSACLGLTFLGSLGTTLCYHRSLTHKAVQFHPAVEQILIFFTVFAGIGAPRTWVASHRLHHAKTDTPADLSSPHYGGFWWAHMRWLWQGETVDMERYAFDLGEYRYRIWDTISVPIMLVSGFFGLYWGPQAWIWLGPVRLFLLMHGQCSVNSLCHMGERDSAPGAGSSRNIWWLAPLFLGVGENWHRNHHADQMNPRLGRQFGQIDLGWTTIRALKAVGLVRKLRVDGRNQFL